MLTKRSTLGLNVIILIAQTPSHRTITADAIASMTNVSLSYIEGILRDAREQGLIRATRGPGAGYQLCVPLTDLSVWMPLCHFVRQMLLRTKAMLLPRPAQQMPSHRKLRRSKKSFFSLIRWLNWYPSTLICPPPSQQSLWQ